MPLTVPVGPHPRRPPKSTTKVLPGMSLGCSQQVPRQDARDTGNMMARQVGGWEPLEGAPEPARVQAAGPGSTDLVEALAGWTQAA